MIEPDQTTRSVGFMSGTSLDGVDAAGIDTDGADFVASGPTAFVPYTDEERADLAAALDAARSLTARADTHPAIRKAATIVENRHLEALAILRDDYPGWMQTCACLGFHGQTVVHRPEIGFTYQIGDPQRISDAAGLPVVADLRINDMASGGEGAPLVPVYHAAVLTMLDVATPAAFVNVGGVANVTFPGPPMVAFDTGPGNALIDDWVRRHGAGPCDEAGRLGLSGRADHARIEAFLAHDFFAAPVPKSLDRDQFSLDGVESLSLEDGAATLAGMTAASIAFAERFAPEKPATWIILGGGRKNAAIMRALTDRVTGIVLGADDVVSRTVCFGLDGDALEAQAFAYMAVRSQKGQPITFPGTTGVTVPLTGGTLLLPKR